MAPTDGTLILLILFGFALLKAEGCMPGYEVERAKLRQYLGIEWVPKGMDKGDMAKSRFVRRAADLNCDFTHPSDCRWQNVRNLDSLDFHLFRKEDTTPFPVVQVHPGPSRVAVGDQLLFTGDRRKTEQSALLTSWPIKCQNSTGVLSFTFWIYNGARIEVVLLEDWKNPETNKTELRLLPEKPHVDCGSVTMDTDCRVEVPPRDVPFRLGIRAYDLSHPDGAFILLDNIVYEASLCKVGVNFGPDFRTEPLRTGAEGMPIQTAKDLQCSQFDESCRWRNGGHLGQIHWQRALTPPSETTIFNETGTFTIPKVPFALLYAEQDQSGGTKLLISDPVQCQASSGATLSFRVWSSAGVIVHACALDFDMNELVCYPVQLGRSPAPSAHHFTQTENFMFAIKATATASDRDIFVIIDDISYEATMCAEAYNSLDLGSNFYTTPLLGEILDRAAHSAKDLDCDFTRRGLDCFWSTLEVEAVAEDEEAVESNVVVANPNKWEIGLGGIDERKFSYLTRRSSLPAADFAIVRFEKFTAKTPALLISETIKCIRGPAMIAFRSWHSGDASLSVCVIRSFTNEILDCQSVTEATEERIEVEIPNYREPVRLAFKAEVPSDQPEAEGFAAVDDIQLHAQICPNVAFSANSGSSRATNHFASPQQPQSDVGTSALRPLPQQIERPTEHSTAVGPDSNVCRLLSCAFELNHMCLYESHRVASSVSMFSAFNRTAHTMLFEKSRVAMLESTPFHLNAPARLHFDYAMTKGTANLHVCQDSTRQELDSCYVVVNAETAPQSLAAGEFIHDFVEILPSDTKLYVIAKLADGSRKANVYIDNLELTNTENQKIC